MRQPRLTSNGYPVREGQIVVVEERPVARPPPPGAPVPPEAPPPDRELWPWLREPPGTVVSQAPKPGNTLKRGDRVLVNASDGSQASRPERQASVPEVVGQDEQSAADALRQAGFTVEVVDVSVGSADQDGLVQDEQPAGGTTVPAGSSVTIYAGRFPQSG